MIKAVIFDLDGTLLNTLDDLAAAMNRMLVRFGYPTHTDLSFHKKVIGYGARNYVKGCMPPEAAAVEEQVDKCLGAYAEEYQGRSNEKTAPYDGILSVLAYLTQENIAISVLSNKPDGATKALVNSWFSEYAITCAYGERPGVPRKPDPKAPLAIAHDLGLSPHEIAFVGDSEVDMQTGKTAGMIPIGVLWGFRTQEQLKEGGATFLADNPQDLIKIFEQIIH
ncbi:MAG: HAD family hydrolase [Ruminococcaceae bacterium]|nr:HAD family hydrolase [Oscillospiraceae bacterium]